MPRCMELGKTTLEEVKEGSIVQGTRKKRGERVEDRPFIQDREGLTITFSGIAEMW
jgi:hypothetical protein